MKETKQKRLTKEQEEFLVQALSSPEIKAQLNYLGLHLPDLIEIHTKKSILSKLKGDVTWLLKKFKES